MAFPLDPRELRFRRGQLGWTQAYMADRVPMSRGHYNGVERGRQGVSYPMAQRIATTLDCEVDDLLTEEFKAQVEAASKKRNVTWLNPPSIPEYMNEDVEGDMDIMRVVELDDETWEDAVQVWPSILAYAG